MLIDVTDIVESEKEESELIADLHALEHDRKISCVHRLEQCLFYAETKLQYAFELLKELQGILNAQTNIVNNLLRAPDNPEELIAQLKKQLEIELILIEKIEKLKSFEILFLSVEKGEHLIGQMNAKEKRLLSKMKYSVHKSFSGEITEGVTHDWAKAVERALQDRFYEMEEEGILVMHPDVEYELVNRSDFEVLVRRELKKLKTNDVSDEMIKVFIHVFRDWFNDLG